MLSTLRGRSQQLLAKSARVRHVRLFSRSSPCLWDLAEYRQHVAERAAEGNVLNFGGFHIWLQFSSDLPHCPSLGVVPKPLAPEHVADLVELMKNPPVGEEATLVDLLSNSVPAGVDQAAYVKASFLTSIVKVFPLPICSHLFVHVLVDFADFCFGELPSCAENNFNHGIISLCTQRGSCDSTRLNKSSRLCRVDLSANFFSRGLAPL